MVTTKRVSQIVRLPLEEDLDRWLASGLITPEVAAAIRSFEAQRQAAVLLTAPPAATQPTPPVAPPSPARPSRVVATLVEMLAYFGSALALAGVILVVAYQWRDFPTWVRLTVSGGAMLACSAIGLSISEHRSGVLTRVRAVVLLAATASAAVLGYVLMRNVRNTNDVGSLFAGAGLCAGVLSALLWQWKQRPLQQATTFLGFGIGIPCWIAVIAGTGYAGLSLWGLSALVVAFALSRLVPNVVISETMGLLGLVVAANVVMSRWPAIGGPLGVATALGLIAIAIVPGIASRLVDQLLNGIFGGLLLFMMAPNTIDHFAMRAPLATGLVTWAIATALVIIGTTEFTRAPVVPAIIGSMFAMIGAAVTGGWVAGFGCLFALGTALVLLAAALVPRLVDRLEPRLAFGIIGAIGGVAAVAVSLVHFSREAGIATGIVAWAGAAALLVIGARRWTRLPVVVECVGGALALAGAAITGRESQDFATLFGLATALGFLGLSLLPGRVLYSLFGCVGILVFVPWTIGWYFPGENRAPLFVTVSGLLVLAVAVILGMSGRRLRRERRQSSA